MQDNFDNCWVMQLLTPDDWCQLREMHILPPGCAEEEEYILLHPPTESAGSDELYA